MASDWLQVALFLVAWFLAVVVIDWVVIDLPMHCGAPDKETPDA